MPSNNPTPLCDATCCYCEDSQESTVVGVSFARRIEKVMHGLAARLAHHTDMLCVCGENDCHKDKQALAEYQTLMKTIEKKEGVEG